MYLLFILYLLVLAVIDAKKKMFSYFMIIIGGILAALCLRGQSSFELIGLLYGLIPGAVLFIVAALTGEKVGYGDAVIMLLIGVAFPFRWAYLTFSIAFLIAFFVAVLLLLLKKGSKNTRMAFVPFLTVGATCTVLGEWVLYG